MTAPDLRLPADLASFLATGEALRYDPRGCECGRVTLLPLAELRLAEIGVTTDGTPAAVDDPNGGRDGSYAVPAVNLVADAEGYDPEFILCWIPDLGEYGAWDADRATLLTFPRTTWANIAANPAAYIDAQWNRTGVGEHPRPWTKFPFRPDGR